MSGYKNGILGVILAAHKLWLDGDERGFRADLRYAHLSRADLRYARLSNADLHSADIRWAYGNGGSEMTCLQDKWLVVITKESIAIGRQQHSPDKWWSFSDKEITGMDSEALDWWRVHKPIIQSLYNAKFGEEK